MPIRLFVKNQPAQTVTKFDQSKPIDVIGAELVAKAKATPSEPVTASVPVVAPVVVPPTEPEPTTSESEEEIVPVSEEPAKPLKGAAKKSAKK